MRHAEVTRLYEHCLRHKCAGQRRSPLHGGGKKTENAQQDGVERTRFRLCHPTVWWLHEALGTNLRLLDPGIGKLLWWFPKKVSILRPLRRVTWSWNAFLNAFCPQPAHTFHSNMCASAQNGHEACWVAFNTAKNRLEILSTTVDYSLPLCYLLKSCHDTR